MRLLNLACGAVRPQSTNEVEWTNLDNLHPVLAEGSAELSQLKSEPNYYEFDILSGPIPMEDGYFDGILASHCVEHWTCNEAITIMKDCLRLLKPSGTLMVSVPDASYFRSVNEEDNIDNAIRLFGEPIHLPDGEVTFLGYALFNRFHKTILTEDALWCYFTRAGFLPTVAIFGEAAFAMEKLLNRRQFSLVMAGVKP